MHSHWSLHRRLCRISSHEGFAAPSPGPSSVRFQSRRSTFAARVADLDACHRMMVGGGYVDDASKAEATFKEFWESQPSQPKTAFVSVDPQIWKEKGKEGVLEHLRAGVKHGLGL